MGNEHPEGQDSGKAAAQPEGQGSELAACSRVHIPASPPAQPPPFLVQCEQELGWMNRNGGVLLLKMGWRCRLGHSLLILFEFGEKIFIRVWSTSGQRQMQE